MDFRREVCYNVKKGFLEDDMPERHSICLLNDSFPPAIDGVANVVVNYGRHIEERLGHAVVVTPAHPDADDEAMGFPFPVLRYPSVDTRKLVGYVTGFPFSPELASRLQSERIELLHTHCPMVSALLAREFRDVLDVPVVFTYHTKFDIDIAKAVKGKLLQATAIRALVQNISACDEVWVVSRGAGENLRSLGYEGEYRVMENGVDVPRERVPDVVTERAVSGYDLPAGVPVFLFVGRLMWYKGLRLILDALAALRAKGSVFRMVFVGDGADGEEIRACAAELGLSDVCFFTGALRDRDAIRGWYARADLFLFPSTFDTNGLVVREAAASGLAAVLIAGSCAAEGVTDGKNGFLIDENAPALAAKLETLCRDRSVMCAVGEGAARDLYLSWEDAVARAYDRYEVVIDRWRAGGFRRKKRPGDEVFRAQGELMTVLGKVEERGEELEQRLDELLSHGPLYRTHERWWMP